MTKRRLLLILSCVVSLHLCACATPKPLAPVTAYSGDSSRIALFEGKRVVVLSPLSLKKIAELDTEKVAHDANEKRKEEGKDSLSAFDSHVLHSMPFYLTLSAQFPHILVDALKKSGINAVAADAISMPDPLPQKREAIFEIYRNLGFDYVLFAGTEQGRVKGKGILTEERHAARNIATHVATLGLVPIHTSTFALNYDRTVEVISTAPGLAKAQNMFPTDVAYEETVNSLTHGFKYPERYAHDLNAAQQEDVTKILQWLKALDGGTFTQEEPVAKQEKRQ